MPSGSNSALWVFIAYTLAVFALAGLAHRVLMHRRFLSEYFLGSRGLGVVAFTLTYGATSASAGSFAGFPAFIYTHGWVLALWIASYMVVPLCGMGLMGKRMNQFARRAGAITVPDVLRERFGNPVVGLIATVMLVFLLSFYLIPQFKLASLILQQLLGDVPLLHGLTAKLAAAPLNIPFIETVNAEYLACLLIFAVMVIVYTTFGGFRAVVWTDVLQGFVMIAGVLIMLGLALWQVGGLGNATKQMAEMTPPILAQVEFLTENPTSTPLRIQAGTCFNVLNPLTGKATWVRINESTIAPSDRPAGAVIITSRIEEQRIERMLNSNRVNSLPQGVVPKFSAWPGPNGGFKAYARGHNQPGVYVTAPGPHRDDINGFLPLGVAISFFFFWAISGTGQPGNMVRLMAFDSSKTLKRGIAALTVYFGLIYFPLVIIFCCARVLEPGLDQTPDRIMPMMAFSLSQAAGAPWLAGLLVAAPFAAAMSTVDSFLLMISSALARDVYQRNIDPKASPRTIKWISYGCTLMIGVVVTIGAINPPQFMQYLIVFTGGGLAVTFLFPMALSLYWPRYNTAGAIASMIGGFAVYLGLYLLGFKVHGRPTPYLLLSFDPLIWGFFASCVLGVIVAKLTNPPPMHLVEKFFYKPGETQAQQ